MNVFNRLLLEAAMAPGISRVSNGELKQYLLRGEVECKCSTCPSTD